MLMNALAVMAVVVVSAQTPLVATVAAVTVATVIVGYLCNS